MSTDLIWLLTRSNNSFLVKRNGVQFSTEPGNLLNKNSRKYSGFAHKPVAITASGKGIQVSIQKSKTSLQKVKKSVQSSVVSKPARTCAKKVRNMVKHYRPDLVNVAMARAGRLIAGNGPVKQVKVKRSSK